MANANLVIRRGIRGVDIASRSLKDVCCIAGGRPFTCNLVVGAMLGKIRNADFPVFANCGRKEALTLFMGAVLQSEDERLQCKAFALKAVNLRVGGPMEMLCQMTGHHRPRRAHRAAPSVTSGKTPQTQGQGVSVGIEPYRLRGVSARYKQSRF